MSKLATPGPWRIHRYATRTGIEQTIITQDKGETYGANVCRVDVAGRRNGTLEADARLIAAAPVLRDALEALAEWATDPRLALVAAQVPGLPGPDALIVAADRALATARGEDKER